MYIVLVYVYCVAYVTTKTQAHRVLAMGSTYILIVILSENEEKNASEIKTAMYKNFVSRWMPESPMKTKSKVKYSLEICLTFTEIHWLQWATPSFFSCMLQFVVASEGSLSRSLN